MPAAVVSILYTHPGYYKIKYTEKNRSLTSGLRPI
jgi:hypothetical protein